MSCQVQRCNKCEEWRDPSVINEFLPGNYLCYHCSEMDDIYSYGADLMAEKIDREILDEIHILAMKQNAMLGIHTYRKAK